MKNILLLTLMLFSSTLFAQKIIKSEKDDFTGNNIVETDYVKFSDGFTCSLRSVNNTHTLLVSFNCDDKIYIMEEYAQFMLKLKNDSIIILSNLQGAVAEHWSVTIGSTYISHFTLKTKYILSKENLQELKENKIIKVRFHTTDGYIEREVSDKNSNKLLKLFNLIS